MQLANALLLTAFTCEALESKLGGHAKPVDGAAAPKHAHEHQGKVPPLSTETVEKIFSFSQPFPVKRVGVAMFTGKRVPPGKQTHRWGKSDMWLKAAMTFVPNVTALNGIHPPVPFLINIGAHYAGGIDDIVSYVMQSNEVSGFAVDSDDAMPWAGSLIRKHTGFVNPTNIISVLQAAHVPSHPILLKVDIDSYDVDVALTILKITSPMFIFVELNEKVPPPMCYCNKYSPGWARVDGDAYGCSLTGFVNAFAPKGYELVSVILNDALFVRSDQASLIASELPAGKLPTPTEAFDVGYRNYPGRAGLFPWNRHVESWVDTREPVEARARQVGHFFKSHGNGEGKGYTYAFVGNAKEGVWPCEAVDRSPAVAPAAVGAASATAAAASTTVSGITPPTVVASPPSVETPDSTPLKNASVG